MGSNYYFAEDFLIAVKFPIDVESRIVVKSLDDMDFVDHADFRATFFHAMDYPAGLDSLVDVHFRTDKYQAVDVDSEQYADDFVAFVDSVKSAVVEWDGSPLPEMDRIHFLAKGILIQSKNCSVGEQHPSLSANKRKTITVLICNQ